MKQNATELISLAKYAGGRFDLVQAGGGNVSWKTPDGLMWVKTSGISLSDMNSLEQCACLKIADVKAILKDAGLKETPEKTQREKLAKTKLDQINLTPDKRPSIEAFLHVLLAAYTLHTHAIVVNQLVVRQDAKLIITTLFPEAVYVPYATPGIDLAFAMHQAIEQYEQRYHQPPQIVFFENHGLLVSAAEAKMVETITEQVLQRIEQFLQLDYQRYHNSSKIANLFADIYTKPMIAWLSEDQLIAKIWQKHPQLLDVLPTSPDMFVFNGYAVCYLKNIQRQPIDDFFNQYGAYPKVVCYQQQLYFIHHNVRKAKEMEEVFKFHLMVLEQADGKAQSLPLAELNYLANWEAEHYRQKL